MSPTHSPDQFHVRIDGDVSGQVAIGNNILQIGDIHGGIVNIIAPNKKPNYAHKAQPVYVRPRPFPGLLDRTEEIKKAVGALCDSESLSLQGANGLGKTTLLRHLAYNAPADNFPDGVLYYYARGVDHDDLLEIIFETFYESDCTAKPTGAELHQFLQNIKALILLDDITLDYSRAAELTNAAPQCVFVFSAAERCLWGEGRCIELEGLPVKEALALFERELGRSLKGQEQAAAESVCQKAKGHPLQVIQTAALVRRGMTLKEIMESQQESEDAFLKSVIAKLSDAEKLILSVLAVTGDVPLPDRRLSELCPMQNRIEALKSLLEMRLIQSHSPAYSSAGSLALSFGRITNLDYWEDNLLKYFVSWIKQDPPLQEVTETLDLLLLLIEKASRTNRWDDVIALGRGLERALILGRRWSAWAWTLDLILKAAQSLNDRAVQGWVFHELGTRSLCLGDQSAARQSLIQALTIREAIGDHAGAAVTRHNLGLLPAPPAPPRETPRSGPKPGAGGGGSLTLKIILIVLAVALVALPLIQQFISGLPRVFQPGPPAPKPKPAATTQKPVAPLVLPSATPRPTLPPYPTDTFVPTLLPCATGVWYCENFNDGLAQDWQLDPGWSIQNDGSNQVLGGRGHTFATLWKYSWSDYQVGFRLRLFSGTIHLNYRLLPGDNNLIRYLIGFQEGGLYLTRQVNDQFIDLTKTQARHSLNDWHTVAIAGWGGHLRVYVDGKLELEYVDSDPITQGSIAFETLDNSSAQIDDIEVTGSGPEPTVVQQGAAPEQPSGANPPTDSNSGPVIIIPAASLAVRCSSYYMTLDYGTDRSGMDYKDYDMGLVGDTLPEYVCRDDCYSDDRCQAYTYNKSLNHCWLKDGIPAQTSSPAEVSGIKVCQ